MWSEINPRVNYPIKAILVEMIENADINIDNSLHLFCVSWFAIKVVLSCLEELGITILSQVNCNAQ